MLAYVEIIELMKHTENEIRLLAIKIMSDLEKDYYYKNEIYIQFSKKRDLPWVGNVENCWSVSLEIPNEQFPSAPDGDSIILHIDDETGKVYEYREGPGRPVPTTVKLNSKGKYEFAQIES